MASRHIRRAEMNALLREEGGREALEAQKPWPCFQAVQGDSFEKDRHK